MWQYLRSPRAQYRLAWFLFLLLLFVAAFGSYLMPHTIGPDDKIAMTYISKTGEKIFTRTPVEPNADFWVGTDHRGFDILSLILNGAKYTLGFVLGVTLLRFLIALPLGLLAGVRNGWIQKTVHALQLVLTSVPPLLFIFPLAYGIYRALGLNGGIPANDPKNIGFMLIVFFLLVFVGVFPLANQFAERARYYSGKLYISAARTMGASTGRIVSRHLLPHLRPELVFAFIMEFVQALFLLGQLAVFSIFIGGGEPFQVDDRPPTYIPLTNTGEWGGLIAYGVRFIKPYPWIILTVGTFFTASVLILSFFAKQLKQRLEQPYLYQSKPLLRIQTFELKKGALAMTALTVAAAALLVTTVPNKAPVFKTQADIKQEQVDQKTAMEQLQHEIETSAGTFLTLLGQGNWDEAKKHLSPELQATPDAPEPFATWMAGLQSGDAQVTQLIKPYMDWPNKLIIVEVQVRNRAGDPNVWLLDYPLPAPEAKAAPHILSGRDQTKERAAQQAKMTPFADEFVRHILANDWQAVSQRSTRSTYLAMPRPFGGWVSRFNQGHQYQGIGTVRPLEDGNFTVEVKVLTPDGQPASWSLTVTPYTNSSDGQPLVTEGSYDFQ